MIDMKDISLHVLDIDMRTQVAEVEVHVQDGIYTGTCRTTLTISTPDILFRAVEEARKDTLQWPGPFEARGISRITNKGGIGSFNFSKKLRMNDMERLVRWLNRMWAEKKEDAEADEEPPPPPTVPDYTVSKKRNPIAFTAEFATSSNDCGVLFHRQLDQSVRMPAWTVPKIADFYDGHLTEEQASDLADWLNRLWAEKDSETKEDPPSWPCNCPTCSGDKVD